MKNSDDEKMIDACYNIIESVCIWQLICYNKDQIISILSNISNIATNCLVHRRLSESSRSANRHSFIIAAFS